ncbi:MAG: hypothetical protein JWR21_967 [Herminiimonas sp.]|nr:hypothetical protein [Herminiimonas sp.]MDB5852379.1 hypothetical protein [Herminiimonas sp.]
MLSGVEDAVVPRQTSENVCRTGLREPLLLGEYVCVVLDRGGKAIQDAPWATRPADNGTSLNRHCFRKVTRGIGKQADRHRLRLLSRYVRCHGFLTIGFRMLGRLGQVGRVCFA